MKPVFHTQMALSTAEMPRKTNMMVSDPLARTFMTYLTVMTDLSSMLALMYFWQHIPQKTILEGGAETPVRSRTETRDRRPELLRLSAVLTKGWPTATASRPSGRPGSPARRRNPAR